MQAIRLAHEVELCTRTLCFISDAGERLLDYPALVHAHHPLHALD